MTNSATLTTTSRDASLSSTSRNAVLSRVERNMTYTLVSPATPRIFLATQDGFVYLLETNDKIIIGAV